MLQTHRRAVLVLVLLTSVLFLTLLGNHGLLEPDEGRYSEIPREMIETGDFITPHLNYVKYFEKPVLHYWLTAASFKVFGYTEFASRFPVAFMGVVGVVITYLLGVRFYGKRAAFLAGLILATCLEYYALAHINIIDMTVSVFITAALTGFWLGHTWDKRFYYLLYAAMALALLSKGLIGIVLPVMVIGAWIVITRQWKVIREVLMWQGILLFFIISVPWFALVSMRNEEFLWFFFIREHFLRYATKFAQRYQPPYFFIVILPAALAPWTGLIFRAVAFATPRNWRELFREKAGETFLLLWAVLILVFFSLSDSKLIPYILPIFPPLAILTGYFLDQVMQKQDFSALKQGLLINSIFTLPLGAMALVYPYLDKRFGVVVLQPLGIPLAIALIGGTIAAWVFYFKRNSRSVVASLLIMAFALGFSLKSVFAFYGQFKSSKELSNIIASHHRLGDTVVDYRTYDQGLAYYLKRRIIIVEYIGELEFGSQIGDQSEWFVSEDKFKQLWNSDKRVFAVVHNNEPEQLMAKGFANIVIVGKDYDKKIVIVNKPLEGSR